MTLVQMLAGLALVLLILAIYLAFLSRHKKSATGAINLTGSRGVVQTRLDPDGAILVDGELWPARASDGGVLEEGQTVRVRGLDGPIVIVEPVSER